jgi:hypothetical protein
MAKRTRGAKSFARRGPVREPHPFVLIVCEGAKTEPNYFGRFRSAYRLSSANIHIMPADGTDPMSIVAFAERELVAADYDRAYCVFDRDGHANYGQALQRVAQSDLSKTGRLVAIPSVPCFEIWVLLHFNYSTTAYNTVGQESACARVIREVKKHLPKYAKGYASVFDELESRMEQAIKHAMQLEVHNSKTRSSNPATQLHKLVDFLRKLKGS